MMEKQSKGLHKSLFTLLVLLFIQPLMAQQILDIETMIGLKRLSPPVISNDGKKACYVVEEVSIKENRGYKDLYLHDLVQGTVKRLTETLHNEWSPSFSRDGRFIYFLSNEDKSAQLYSLQLDNLNKEKLSAITGGIGSYKLSADNSAVAFTNDVKTGKELVDIYPDLLKADARIIDDLMYRHWDSWDDYHSTHLFYAAFNPAQVMKEGKRIIENEPFDVENFDISPNGKWVAYACKKMSGKDFALSTNTDIYLYFTESGKTTNISEGIMGYDMNPVFSPDGSAIIWESMKKDGFESDKSSIVRYTFAAGRFENLNPEFEESASSLTWSPDSKTIYFISAKEATHQLFSLETANKKIKQLTTGDHDFKSLSISNGLLYALQTTMQRPAELFSFNLKDNKLTQITQLNTEALKQFKPVTIEKRWVNTTDGKKMLVWHILPPDFDPNKKYPALLYCQGGPQSVVSCNFSFRWNLYLMASKGYVVVAPNRRGLPSFGKSWNDDISGDWGGQPMRDYLSAIDDAAQLPFVDKSKLGAVGASYGGYSVYWLAGNHNKRFKSFISHCGLFNLDSWYTTTEEMFFANHDIEGPYWNPELKDKYRRFSPKEFVGNWDTPMLVIHGEKDFRVPVSEGMQAFGVLQLQNIPSRFLYFPEEGHWVMKPQNSVLWHRVFYDWLDKTLK
jgi:dipeptidyl aminopeptidase/acylaminoacyl peptidase